ncbi:hypothetical protein OROGR_025879 [Orobanche gracilis]
MAANPFAALPTSSRFHTPSFYSTPSAFFRFSQLCKFSCFSPRQKSANNRLLFSCRCCALTAHDNHSTVGFSDPM